MEGLLPLVYRAIKKRKIRRQYRCLSSGATLSYNVNVLEFYPQNQGHQPSTSTQNAVYDHTDNVAYSRSNSASFTSPQPRTCSAGSPDSNQLVRFRTTSHKMFSCLAG